MKKRIGEIRQTVTLPNGRKITADRDTLNTLSGYAAEAGRAWDARGCHAIARVAYADADAIYYALDEAGYYDDFRTEDSNESN